MRFFKVKDPLVFAFGVGYYANARVKNDYHMSWALLFFVGPWAFGFGKDRRRISG